MKIYFSTAGNIERQIIYQVVEYIIRVLAILQFAYYVFRYILDLEGHTHAVEEERKNNTQKKK